MTEPFRLGLKLFAEGPEQLKAKAVVPVFHSWIQQQCVDGHVLIDVHDYSHIHHGPGILLVADEGNFSTDLGDGRLGLLYIRKRTESSLEDTLRQALKTALLAASLLENEPQLKGALRFRKDEALIVSNDRLLAPNDNVAFEAVRPALSAVFGSGAKLEHAAKNPKERLGITVKGIRLP